MKLKYNYYYIMAEIIACIVLLTLGHTLYNQRNNNVESLSSAPGAQATAGSQATKPAKKSKPVKESFINSASFSDINLSNTPQGYDYIVPDIEWDENVNINYIEDPYCFPMELSFVPYAKKFTQNVETDNRHALEMHRMMGIDENWKPKQETEPFFELEEDLGYVNGSPLNLETELERIQPSRYSNNVLPFEQIISALEDNQTPMRDLNSKSNGLDRQMPLNVDDLRALSNQKLSGVDITDLMGPLKALVESITTMEQLGEFNVKKKIEELLIEYIGIGHSPNLRNLIEPLLIPYIESAIENIKKQQLEGLEIGAAYQSTKQVIVNLFKETFVFKKKLLIMTEVLNLMGRIKPQIYNRQINHNKVGPLNDDIDYNRNLLGHIREILPFLDEAVETIREQTEINERDGNIGGLHSTYITILDEIRTTIRETTENNKHNGNLTGHTRHVLGLMDDLKTTLKEIIIGEYEKLNISVEVKNPTIYNKQPAKTTIRETLEYVDTSLNLNTLVDNSYIKDGYNAPTTLRETLDSIDTSLNLSSIEKVGAYLVQLLNIDLIKTNRSDYDENQILELLNGIIGSSQILKPTTEMEASVTTLGNRVLVEDRIWTPQGPKAAPKVEDINLTVERLLDYYNQLDHTTLKQYNSLNMSTPGDVTSERIEYDNINEELFEDEIDSRMIQFENNPLVQTPLSQHS
jgi:hypothetical protein